MRNGYREDIIQGYLDAGASVLARDFERSESILLLILRRGNEIIAPQLLHSAWQQRFVVDRTLIILFFDFILERQRPEHDFDISGLKSFARFSTAVKTNNFQPTPIELEEIIHYNTLPEDLRERIEFLRLVIRLTRKRIESAGEVPRPRNHLSELFDVCSNPFPFAKKIVSLYQYTIPHWLQVQREWEREDAEFATADEWSSDSEIDIQEDAEYASAEEVSSEPGLDI